MIVMSVAEDDRVGAVEANAQFVGIAGEDCALAGIEENVTGVRLDPESQTMLTEEHAALRGVFHHGRNSYSVIHDRHFPSSVGPFSKAGSRGHPPVC